MRYIQRRPARAAVPAGAQWPSSPERTDLLWFTLLLINGYTRVLALPILELRSLCVSVLIVNFARLLSPLPSPLRGDWPLLGAVLTLAGRSPFFLDFLSSNM